MYDYNTILNIFLTKRCAIMYKMCEIQKVSFINDKDERS